MDSQTLFRDGVIAIKEKRDLIEGRKLLTQALRLDPNNEMAWVWLSRTVTDQEKKLQCLDRALSINPDNDQALALREKLLGRDGELAPADAPMRQSGKKKPHVPTPEEEKRIKTMLNKAETLLSEEKTEDAIEQWVRVLDIQPDHEMALGNAVRYLSRLKYVDDAKELVSKAIESGTTTISIYMTAIDIAKHQGDQVEADGLRDRLARLPTTDDATVSKIIDYYVENGMDGKAVELLEHALETHGNSQKLLIRMGDLEKAMSNEAEARKYYERAARLGTRTKEGKAADTKLMESAPLLTDKERGSFMLAFREALGFGVAFLLMGWQDAGLNFAFMGSSRWLGVAISVVGGYLLITATSSAQQKPLARILGGQVPEKKKKEKPKQYVDQDGTPQMGVVHDDTELPIIPMGLRAFIGIVGLAILIFAFMMVFSQAIQLLGDPTPPSDIPTIQELYEAAQ
jgi:tetratricopeptide (TPR) repeat protein